MTTLVQAFEARLGNNPFKAINDLVPEAQWCTRYVQTNDAGAFVWMTDSEEIIKFVNVSRRCVKALIDQVENIKPGKFENGELNTANMAKRSNLLKAARRIQDISDEAAHHLAYWSYDDYEEIEEAWPGLV